MSEKVFTDCKRAFQVFFIHVVCMQQERQGSCSMTSIQYVFLIYLSDRIRLIRLSIHWYKQSVWYLQTMLKSYVPHNYFQKQLNILAPIYKQTVQFVSNFYAGNIILQHIEVNT